MTVSNNILQMRNKQLSSIYRESVLGQPVQRPIYLHVLREADEKPKKYSKKELATIIAAQDIKLEVGSSSKDVRIQPIGVFDATKFSQTLEDAGLTVIDVVRPGEEGSTSGQLRTYIVQDENKNEYSVVLGKGKGFGTVDEDLVLNNLEDQVKALLLQNDVEYITIDINGYSQKIDNIKTTTGTPKSDFNFTYKGKPVLFISHKAGKRASDYQQYGGITCKSGEDICKHEEVEEFVAQIKDMYRDGMPPGKSLWKKIRDPELKKLSLYGENYGKEYGINNVNGLYQGNITIDPLSDDVYKLEAHHILYNGDIPEGSYEPVLYARYSGSRGGNHGIKDLRTAILPLAKVSKNTQDIKLNKANIAAIDNPDTEIEDLL